ncbi:hypothetical protein, variant [Aphanomyces invadans]|uniref:protein-tyrosine-phosphatase n=1 Tax=Aphanomyces invadans TaxID=157072 RepID=A0A024TN30_9STRA|nr:hypothetical protein, variant [Aphanomyces invadans]ETV95570.1 hypothetical protein, variant [Aphanomyces invadans]|eukprot:XP_008875763.1 hypothetical protein, variant [Aphanomyces invadans]
MADDGDSVCTPQVAGIGPMAPVLSRTQSDMTSRGPLHRRRFLNKSSKRALLFSPDEGGKRSRSATTESERSPPRPITSKGKLFDRDESCEWNELPPSLVPTNLEHRSHSCPGPMPTLEVYVPLLPLIKSSKLPDLNVISPATVQMLLDGSFNDVLHGFHFIDCRFDHEFVGGTLQGAKSLMLPQDVEAEFFHPKAYLTSKRTALILFCEYSAQRAPKMARHIRNLDRRLHADKYPTLHYPELYVIDGGYKHCFESHQGVCAPPASYVAMDHPDHVEACKKALSGLRSSWKKLRTPSKASPKWC